MSPLLDVEHATKVVGGVRAVDGCSFAAEGGTITAVIGPNGSGKTTLFNLITGYLPPDRGRVRFRGRDITGLDAGRLYRHGLSRTFQQARVFPHLSVQENLVAAGGVTRRALFPPPAGPAAPETTPRPRPGVPPPPAGAPPPSDHSYSHRT